MLEAVFSKKYAEDAWTNGSGPGSFVSVNEEYLRFLGNFIRDNNITSICDVGCGDFQLMRNLDLNHCRYVGMDVVPELIARNRSRYASGRITFEVMPADVSRLPLADLSIIKDVLIHLDNPRAQNLLKGMIAKSKYVITVNNRSANVAVYNADIEPGGFRPVDVSRHPFNLKAVNLLTFGKARILDPRYPAIFAFLTRKFSWPDYKHLQLILGDRMPSGRIAEDDPIDKEVLT